MLLVTTRAHRDNLYLAFLFDRTVPSHRVLRSLYRIISSDCIDLSRFESHPLVLSLALPSCTVMTDSPQTRLPTAVTSAAASHNPAVSPSRGVAAMSAGKRSANWVQCDRCQKWRLLPMLVDASKLPDNWYCDMNRWDTEHNSCSAPEEGDHEPESEISEPADSEVA